jgi:hypothetical protein
VKITESYHKFLGLTRIGVGCEGDRNGFVVMILSIVQDIWVGIGWIEVEIGKGYCWIWRVGLRLR